MAARRGVGGRGTFGSVVGRGFRGSFGGRAYFFVYGSYYEGGFGGRGGAVEVVVFRRVRRRGGLRRELLRVFRGLVGGYGVVRVVRARYLYVFGLGVEFLF